MKGYVTNGFEKRLRGLMDVRLRMAEADFAAWLGISMQTLSAALIDDKEPPQALIAGVYAACPEHLYWLVAGVDEIISPDSLISPAELNHILSAMRDYSLPENIRKSLLINFMQDYLRDTSGTLKAGVHLEQLSHLFNLFGLGFAESDMRQIPAFSGSALIEKAA